MVKAQKAAERQALLDEIVERISKGETLRAICREEGKPSWRSVYDWIAADEIFASRIAHARELGHDAIAEECLEISDQSGGDYRFDPEKGLIVDTDHIQRAKLKIETRLKLLAKWSSGKYADKIQQQHTGANGGPIKTEVATPFDKQILEQYMKQAMESK